MSINFIWTTAHTDMLGYFRSKSPQPTVEEILVVIHKLETQKLFEAGRVELDVITGKELTYDKVLELIRLE